MVKNEAGTDWLQRTLTMPSGTGLAPKPDFMRGARPALLHPVSAHFCEHDARRDFLARVQCKRRPAVHRQERNSLLSLALRNDADQLWRVNGLGVRFSRNAHAVDSEPASVRRCQSQHG